MGVFGKLYRKGGYTEAVVLRLRQSALGQLPEPAVASGPGFLIATEGPIFPRIGLISFCPLLTSTAHCSNKFNPTRKTFVFVLNLLTLWKAPMP